MPQKEGISMTGFFEKVSDYPRTSLVSTLSVVMAASTAYILSRRRREETRVHLLQVEDWQEKTKRRADYEKILGLPIYDHVCMSNGEIFDRQKPPQLMRNLDPVSIIYPRAK